MKFTRDPITQYPAVEIMGKTIVLQKDTANPKEAMQKPAKEVVECAL